MEHASRPSPSLNGEPRLTAQVPTTHELNTASLQLPTQRQERTPIDTNLSLMCKRHVPSRLCSHCCELHPRFDQKPASDCEARFGLHDQTVTVSNRAWTKTTQPQKLQVHKPYVNNNGIQISNKICFERRTVKTLVLNRFWIKH